MRYVIFGESHGPAIGVVLEGVPAGLELDLEPGCPPRWPARAPGEVPCPPPGRRRMCRRSSPACLRAGPRAPRCAR